MFRQPLHRGQRSKGFKVKHVLQICVALGISLWLLYQVKRSQGNKSPNEGTGIEVVKLGRKDLPQVDETVVKDAKPMAEEGEKTTNTDMNQKIGLENEGERGNNQEIEEAQRNEENNNRNREEIIKELSKDEGGEKEVREERKIPETNVEQNVITDPQVSLLPAESNDRSEEGAREVSQEPQNIAGDDVNQNKPTLDVIEPAEKKDDLVNMGSEGENQNRGAASEFDPTRVTEFSDKPHMFKEHPVNGTKSGSSRPQKDDVRDVSIRKEFMLHKEEKIGPDSGVEEADLSTCATTVAENGNIVVKEYLDSNLPSQKSVEIHDHHLSENKVADSADANVAIISKREDSRTDYGVKEAQENGVLPNENGNLMQKQASLDYSRENGNLMQEQQPSTESLNEGGEMMQKQVPRKHSNDDGELMQQQQEASRRHSNENGNLMQHQASMIHSNENAVGGGGGGLVMPLNKNDNLGVVQKPQVDSFDPWNPQRNEAFPNAGGNIRNPNENINNLRVIPDRKEMNQVNGIHGQNEHIRPSNIQARGATSSNDNGGGFPGENGNESLQQSITDENENRRANRDALQNDQVDSSDSQGLSEDGNRSNASQQENPDTGLPQDVKDARMDLGTLPENNVPLNTNDHMASE